MSPSFETHRLRDALRMRVVTRGAQSAGDKAAGYALRLNPPYALPAIGERAGDVSRARRVTHERTGLEQIGTARPAIRHGKIGTAAGERKARNGTRRKYIIRADGGTGDATGRSVGADRRIAIRVL